MADLTKPPWPVYEPAPLRVIDDQGQAVAVNALGQGFTAYVDLYVRTRPDTIAAALTPEEAEQLARDLIAASTEVRRRQGRN